MAPISIANSGSVPEAFSEELTGIGLPDKEEKAQGQAKINGLLAQLPDPSIPLRGGPAIAPLTPGPSSRLFHSIVTQLRSSIMDVNNRLDEVDQQFECEGRSH